MFVRILIRRSSNHNYSLHTEGLFTQDWLNSFWIAIVCSVLSFSSQGKQSDECTWRRMSLPSRNLYTCKQVVSVIVACIFSLRLSLQSCCCLFTCLFPFYTALCCCLFTSLSLFYTDVVAIFLFIRWSCKQVHCVCFLSFCLFVSNNTISIFVIIRIKHYI